MKIELRDIDAVRPYEKNPRLNDGAVEAVARSLKAFGFRQPIVVDADGVIIVGHTRWKAARALGLQKVPVHEATDLSPEQVKAYRIADNQTATIAEWDMELLPLELADLQAMNFELGLLGFAESELDRLLSAGGGTAEGLTDEDDVPLAPDEATTRPGDVWVLGKHRLMCGDSSKPEDLDRLLAGAVIHLVNTDPPYNVKVEPRSNNAFVAGETSFHPVPKSSPRSGQKVKATDAKLRAKDRPLKNDCVSDEEFARLLDAWFANIARVLLPGHGFYIWGGYANVANYPPALAKNDLYFSQSIIWHKQHPVISRKDFMGDHEWAFYGWRAGAAHRFFGPNNVPDVWSVKKVNPQNMVHLTEKPVELAKRAIEYSSRPGENVLDLFGGSGSTLIGCEQTGRRAFLMELDPLYCDVIVQRFEKFTGKKAERLGSDALPAGVAGQENLPSEPAGAA
jgi:DNA modification methylase